LSRSWRTLSANAAFTNGFDGRVVRPVFVCDIACEARKIHLHRRARAAGYVEYAPASHVLSPCSAYLKPGGRPDGLILEVLELPANFGFHFVDIGVGGAMREFERQFKTAS
jgi:hypothetical protein